MRTQIIYEDNDMIVCRKPAGFPVQTKKTSQPDMESELLNYLHRKGDACGRPYIGIIHRLDQPVEGLLVFAKNPAAASKLNKQMQEDGFGKYYVAEISGAMEQNKGTLTDYLVKNAKESRAELADAGRKDAKKAVLHYEVLKNMEDSSFIMVRLKTGRFHQIRAQLSGRGRPIIGDRKYGSSCCQANGCRTIHLCAWRLEFCHPVTGERMKFEICPDWYDKGRAIPDSSS